MTTIVVNPYEEIRRRRTAQQQQPSNTDPNDAPDAAPDDASNNEDTSNAVMGIQSQKRLKTTTQIRNKPDHQKKQYQQALDGTRAFDFTKDCETCKAKIFKLRVPHRKHHRLCPNNPRTKGLVREVYEQEKRHQDRIKVLNTPINKAKTSKKRHEYVNMYTRSGFFKKSKKSDSSQLHNTTTQDTQEKTDHGEKKEEEPVPVSQETVVLLPPLDNKEELYKNLHRFIDDCVRSSDQDFKRGSAPSAVVATVGWLNANIVPNNIVSRKKRGAASTPRAMEKMNILQRHFGLNMHFTIPDQSQDGILSPALHSVAGTKIYFVFWELFFPSIEIKCPCCGDSLNHERTNFSKNKGTLFPLFSLGRQPDWAVVMKYNCTNKQCMGCFDGNDGAILHQLPEYIRKKYPVYPKHATGTFHLTKVAADLLEDTMVTYGNGEFFSKLLYNSINRDYLNRLEDYLSYHVGNNLKAERYPEKDGEFLKVTPPNGLALRNLYQYSASSINTHGQVSDKDRHTREMQAVECKILFAQDHTMEVRKNYQGKLGAHACWDVATETGEIASAVLVQTTKAQDYAHAAESLIRRPGFKPKAMYSDTWPSNDAFWTLLFKKTGIKGALGLFHYSQRIIKTLRPSHIDYPEAVWDLMTCIYELDQQDMDKLYDALMSGRMHQQGHKYTHEEIEDLKMNKKFKNRYFKYLKKNIRTPAQIHQRFDNWWNKYKVEASKGKEQGKGRLDPRTRKKLFTPDTKDAIHFQKQNACWIQDPLPTKDMYRVVKQSPNSKHGLVEYSSYRPESKIEAYHDHLGHFANSGMSEDLADALNLAGTARYNVAIRHKLWLETLPPHERGKTTLDFEKIPSYWNHTQLNTLNDMANKVGWETKPFPFAKPLPEDNGERFFSQYLHQQKMRIERYPPHRENSRCQCTQCARQPRLSRENRTPPPADCLITAGNGGTNPATAPVYINTGQAGTPRPQGYPFPRATLPQPQPTTPPPPQPFTNMISPVGWTYHQPFFQQPQVAPPFPMGWPNGGNFPPMFPYPVFNPYTTKPARPKLQKEYCCPHFHWWCFHPCRNGRPPHSDWCENKGTKKNT